MADRIAPDQLGRAIGQVLTVYHDNAIEGVNAAGEKAVKALVKKTKATAPKGHRPSADAYRKRITYTKKAGPRGNTYIWHVKAPDYRLTHLLVHGHATRDGRRTRADPFLRNALDSVLPDYENDVKEALKNGE